MIEETASLTNYGLAGIFIAYLIFDRQILLKGLKETIKDNTRAIVALLDKCNT